MWERQCCLVVRELRKMKTMSDLKWSIPPVLHMIYAVTNSTHNKGLCKEGESLVGKG